MPLGEGWFIDLETGEFIAIYEHARAVLACPDRYRLKKEDVAGIHPVRDRIVLLRKVLANGFVRVRFHKNDLVIEYDFPDRETVLGHMRRFAEKYQLGENTNARINNVRFPEASQSGRLTDILKQK